MSPSAQPNTHPLFKHLKDKKGELLGSDIKWNFAKFLIGRDGEGETVALDCARWLALAQRTDARSHATD